MKVIETFCAAPFYSVQTFARLLRAEMFVTIWLSVNSGSDLAADKYAAEANTGFKT